MIFGKSAGNKDGRTLSDSGFIGEGMITKQAPKPSAALLVSLLQSFGAPVPDEPINNFLPSAKVMFLPFARFERSLLW